MARTIPARPSGLFCTVAVLAVTASTAAAEGTRLLYAEPLVERAPATTGLRAAAAGTGSGAGSLSFDAFGQRFDLELEAHPGFPTQTPTVQHQRGQRIGDDQSWVRLTRNGSRLIGLLHTRGETYGIEPATNLRPLLDPDVPLPPAHNLVYRLSDLMVDPRGLACGLGAASADADATLRALAADLRASAASASRIQRVRIAPLGDAEFVQRYGDAAAGEMLARLNMADGIFRQQAGIDLSAGTPELFPADRTPQPFTSTVAQTLLGQASDYRRDHHDAREFGLTHLFTGKTLETGLAGIAWQGTVCFTREATSLSASNDTLSATMSALVAAHEIAHNLGAPHDGEPASACAATATTYLMAPRVSGSSTLSTCSVGEIADNVARNGRAFAGCFATLLDYDVTAIAPGPVSGRPREPATFTVAVENLGSREISGVTLQLDAPAALVVDSATPDAGGRCTRRAGGASCELPALGTEQRWRASFTTGAVDAGSYSVVARASAAGDEQPANDGTQFSVTIGTQEQLAATVSGEGGGGGGGGGRSDLLLLAIFAMARIRRRRPN